MSHTVTATTARFTVSRQLRWPDGLRIVEISAGGIDFTNPDAVDASRIESFDTLTEAVEYAIEDAALWAKQRRAAGAGRRDRVWLALGNTLGMTMHFDEMPRDAKTLRSLRELATKHDEKLPRCAQCGSTMPADERQWWKLIDDWSGERYCSERCCEREIEFQQQLLEEEREEEENDE